MISQIDARYFKQAVGQDRIKKESTIDISARCPVCNDRKARLHIYYKSGVTLCGCFNGGCDLNTKRNLWNFLKLVSPDLLESYKRESFTDNIANLKNDLGSLNLQKAPEPVLDSWIPDYEIEIDPVKTFDFENLFEKFEGSPAEEYLRTRYLNYTGEYGKYYYSSKNLRIDGVDYKTADSIIIPLYYKEKFHGFYSRAIGTKMFATFNPEINTGYKIWNWFRIDKTKRCYVFEAIFDAQSSKLGNIIALMGASLPEDRLKELSEPVFCFDNDCTGHKKAIEYALKGYEVLVWPPDYPYKDCNSMLQDSVNVQEFIQENIMRGLSAAVRLKALL